MLVSNATSVTVWLTSGRGAVVSVHRVVVVAVQLKRSPVQLASVHPGQ